MNKERIILFDFIRGVSAVLVLISHLRNAIFVDYNDIDNNNYFVKVFYFFTGLGHESVMFFFVLSGFFVGGSVLKNKENFNFSSYLLARISRIWSVLLPSLFITFIIDKVINLFHPDVINGNYLNVLNSGPDSHYSLSLLNFISNTFFCQTIFSPVYGTNGPLWSLSNEFWYYILFPLIFLLATRKKLKLSYRILYLCVTFLILILIHTKIEGLIIWIFGVFVYWMYSKDYEIKNKIVSSFLLVFSLFLIVFSIVISKSNLMFFSADLLIGFSFGIFLLAVKYSNLMVIKNSYFTKMSLFLSEISFSMYLLHFPIVIFIFSFFYKGDKQELTYFNLILFLIILGVIVIISYLFWFLFERKTADFKNMLKCMLDKLKV